MWIIHRAYYLWKVTIHKISFWFVEMVTCNLINKYVGILLYIWDMNVHLTLDLIKENKMCMKCKDFICCLLHRYLHWFDWQFCNFKTFSWNVYIHVFHMFIKVTRRYNLVFFYWLFHIKLKIYYFFTHNIKEEIYHCRRIN